MVRAAPPPMYVHMLTTTRFRFDRKVERERREKKLAAGSCGREVAAEVVYTLPTVVSPAAMVFRLLWCDGQHGHVSMVCNRPWDAFGCMAAVLWRPGGHVCVVRNNP